MNSLRSRNVELLVPLNIAVLIEKGHWSDKSKPKFEYIPSEEIIFSVCCLASLKSNFNLSNSDLVRLNVNA